MRVHVIAPGQTHAGIHTSPGPASEPMSTYAGWRPRCVLGAASPGGLALPSATPSAATLYAPRGVWTDGTRVVVSDSGNHRVLIWHRLPTEDATAADVVLGQQDDLTEGPAASGAGAVNGMHLPTGVLITEERLVIADAWHHRLLVWDTIPTQTGTPPDHVIGQPDLSSIEPNQGRDPDARTLYWPFGIAMIDGRFHVADTGNRRVLIWRDGLPLDGRPADVVLGQPDAFSREENRGGSPGANSFRWPHGFAATYDGGLLVADAGNHRVLRWNVHPDRDRPADAALGQPDLETTVEFPYVSQLGRLRFPYAIASVPGGLAVVDTANNRVALYDDVLVEGLAEPDAMLAQHTLAANGENRWDRVAADSLCWPYGVSWHRGANDLLAVADSGNNRVVLWHRAR